MTGSKNLLKVSGGEENKFLLGKAIDVWKVYLLSETTENNDLFCKTGGSSLVSLLTQLQWGSNVWCSCGNQQLGQTKGRIAAPCFHFLVCRC
jgi:hypothetical protein